MDWTSELLKLVEKSVADAVPWRPADYIGRRWMGVMGQLPRDGITVCQPVTASAGVGRFSGVYARAQGRPSGIGTPYQSSTEEIDALDVEIAALTKIRESFAQLRETGWTGIQFFLGEDA